MKENSKESSLSKLFTTFVFVPLGASLVLSIWMWGVFSIDYLYNEIMQHSLSAFLYKTIAQTITFVTAQSFDPKFLAIILTLAIIAMVIGIALGILSFLIRKIYK
ncbi:MAG: hypothetical protein P8Y22_04095 [Sulfurimonas sp.]